VEEKKKEGTRSNDLPNPVGLGYETSHRAVRQERFLGFIKCNFFFFLFSPSVLEAVGMHGKAKQKKGGPHQATMD
jgi:hypothetical protein